MLAHLTTASTAHGCPHTYLYAWGRARTTKYREDILSKTIEQMVFNTIALTMLSTLCVNIDLGETPKWSSLQHLPSGVCTGSWRKQSMICLHNPNWTMAMSRAYGRIILLNWHPLSYNGGNCDFLTCTCRQTCSHANIRKILRAWGVVATCPDTCTCSVVRFERACGSHSTANCMLSCTAWCRMHKMSGSYRHHIQRERMLLCYINRSYINMHVYKSIQRILPKTY